MNIFICNATKLLERNVNKFKSSFSRLTRMTNPPLPRGRRIRLQPSICFYFTDWLSFAISPALPSSRRIARITRQYPIVMHQHWTAAHLFWDSGGYWDPNGCIIIITTDLNQTRILMAAPWTMLPIGGVKVMFQRKMSKVTIVWVRRDNFAPWFVWRRVIWVRANHKIPNKPLHLSGSLISMSIIIY